ncbi:transmembrane protein 233-like [Ptychodera flava]|uniref:transmembrane protein 233-like n=1 Tax=Ptychodera flava TaxID=63121 RepID=UPI00396A8FF2
MTDPQKYLPEQSPAHGQPVQYGQPAPYDQSAPYGQPAQYGQPPPYGQSAPYGQPVQHGQTSTTVVDAPQPMQMTATVVKSAPPNYLALATFTILFCFIPTGIVASIFAAQVNGAWESGDEDKAYRYSRYAKYWSIASIIIGVVANIVIFAVVFATL